MTEFRIRINKIIELIFTIATAWIITFHFNCFICPCFYLKYTIIGPWYRLIIESLQWTTSEVRFLFHIEWWTSTIDRDKRNCCNWTSDIQRKCGKSGKCGERKKKKRKKSHVKLSSKAIIQPEKIFNGCDLAWWSCHLVFVFFSRLKWGKTYSFFFFILKGAHEKNQLVCTYVKSQIVYIKFLFSVHQFFGWLFCYPKCMHNTCCHFGPSSFVNYTYS